MSHENSKNIRAYEIPRTHVRYDAMRCAETMMMRKLNEEWKCERSQQIKFPLDGIILTANDIKQVFYVHRTVKFIHAHICLYPDIISPFGWVVKVAFFPFEIFTFFLLLFDEHGHILCSVHVITLTPALWLRLLTAIWLTRNSISLALALCVFILAQKIRHMRQRMMYNGISYGKINAMHRFWWTNKYGIEISAK